MDAWALIDSLMMSGCAVKSGGINTWTLVMVPQRSA
jgi:hypothetical protein